MYNNKDLNFANVPPWWTTGVRITPILPQNSNNTQLISKTAHCFRVRLKFEFIQFVES